MRNKQYLDYFLIKAAGAGSVFFVIAVFLSVIYDFRVYDVMEDLSNGMLWLAVFGYGVVCSMLIDGLTRKIEKRRSLVKGLLYIAAGYACFLAAGWNMYMLMAGTVGAGCALLFYAGTVLSRRAVILKYGAAIFVPCLLLILIPIDFTEKEQWTGTRDGTSYAASFEYFHGKHEISVHAEAGQTITISSDFTSTNGGGHGFHVLNEKRELVGMNRIGEETIAVDAAYSGEYSLVVTGSQVAGTFTVDWEVE